MNENNRRESARRAAFALVTAELHATDDNPVDVQNYAATRSEALDIMALLAEMTVGILRSYKGTREQAAEYLRAAALRFEQEADDAG